MVDRTKEFGEYCKMYNKYINYKELDYQAEKNLQFDVIPTPIVPEREYVDNPRLKRRKLKLVIDSDSDGKKPIVNVRISKVRFQTVLDRNNPHKNLETVDYRTKADKILAKHFFNAKKASYQSKLEFKLKRKQLKDHLGSHESFKQLQKTEDQVIINKVKIVKSPAAIAIRQTN